MASYIEGRSTDRRRRRRDLLANLAAWLGVAGWLLLVVVLALLDRARPDDATFTIDPHLYQQSGVPYNLRTEWDQSLLEYTLYLMIAGLALSILGLLFNAIRHKRRDDHYRVHLVLLGVISTAGVIWHIVA